MKIAIIMTRAYAITGPKSKSNTAIASRIGDQYASDFHHLNSPEGSVGFISTL